MREYLIASLRPPILIFKPKKWASFSPFFLSSSFEIQIEICRKLYRSGSKLDDKDDEDSPVTVGHNIYILAHQVREREREREKERERERGEKREKRERGGREREEEKEVETEQKRDRQRYIYGKTVIFTLKKEV